MADVTTHHITTDITPVTPNSNLNHEAGVGDSSIGGAAGVEGPTFNR